MGKMPAQMVTSGTAMKTGVVTAPTRYDHTPVQYMMRSHQGSSRWNSGQCWLDRIIWKCLRRSHARLRHAPVMGCRAQSVLLHSMRMAWKKAGAPTSTN